MTSGKVIDRLLEFAPPFLAASAKSGGRCILATAVGLEVLERFEISAAPLSVRLRVTNHAYIRNATDGLDPIANVLAGGHIIDTGAEADPFTGTTDRGGWYGHLILALEGQAVIDLDLQQLRRPQHAIYTPAASRFAWPGLRLDVVDGKEYTLPNGVRLRYDVRPGDRTWTEARDWTARGRFADIVDAICRRIRKGTIKRGAARP